MSLQTETPLVTPSNPTRDSLSTAVVGLGLFVFGASWLSLFQWLPGSTTVGPLSVFQLLGCAITASGTGLCVLGLLTTAPVESAPSTSRLAFAVPFGGLCFSSVSLVCAHALGWSTVGWLLSGCVAGLVGVTSTLVPRESYRITLAPGVFIGIVGLSIAIGRIGPAWQWSPSTLSVTAIGPVVIPLLAMLCSVLVVWCGATVRGGFGVRGTQHAAVLLISLSVVGLLAVLVLLVGFIVVRGVGTLLTGAGFGLGTATVFGVAVPWPSVSVPFLTNVTQSLYVDIPGVLPAIVGTLWLVVGAVFVAVPMGIATAIFLAEYSRDRRFTHLVEIATNGLWSTPSIVFGLFGLSFLLPRISSSSKSLLGGQLVLGFMLLPLVVITSYESLSAVPDEYRDASAALGVTKWQTIRSVVLPAAMPGVITGIILGVGRIAGETAPLLLVFGGAPFPNQVPSVLGSFELSPSPPFVTNPVLLERGSALPYQLYTTITSGHLPGETFTVQQFGWGTAFVLLLVVLGLYSIAIVTRRYFEKRIHHE